MKKKTIEEVTKSFENKIHILLEYVYINSSTKMMYRCPNGHEHYITWDKWKQGKRCPSCYGNLIITIDVARDHADVEGYRVISKKYINNSSKLLYICPKGHDYYSTWNYWSQGYRCPYCAGNAKLTIEYIRQEFEKVGYILLSKEYSNNYTKLDYVCPNGHQHSITWGKWQQGQRCPKCPKCSDWGTSNFEKEVKDFVLNLGQTIIENDRTTILNPNTNKYLELDILFPCKTKAVECNGVYWHDRPEVMERDLIKQKQCKKLGIALLVITDEEWKTDPNIKQKLLEFIL